MPIDRKTHVAMLIAVGMMVSVSNTWGAEEGAAEAAVPPEAEAPPREVAPAAPPPPVTVAHVPSATAASPASAAIAPAPISFKTESGPGNAIRVGLLLQPQFQAASSPTLDGYAANLYIRRTRILVGGTLFGKVEYFFDTDYPNLFLPANTAAAGAPDAFAKSSPGMNIQDAFATVKVLGDSFKVDVGYMLPPMAHNAVQGAATLYGWDYFGYSFQHSNSFGSTANPIGRDVGVQLRGLVLDGHIEYRLGAFQGLRENRTATDVEARNGFRATGRVQVNLLDAEPGFFYAGTYLGAKKILSVGGSFDFQNNPADVKNSYRYLAGDVFADLPLGPGVGTAQINVAHWNGSTFIPGLVKQTAVMGEAGFSITNLQLSPIVRVERLWGSGALADQTRAGGGVAFWPYGHGTNLKLFYSHLKNDGAARGWNQINLQAQVYFF